MRLSPEIKETINVYLEQGWNPKQVCGWLKKEGLVGLHHETIYQHILKDKRSGGYLYAYLYHQNKACRKRYGSAYNRSHHGISNRVDIDKHPEEANNREQVGPWEGDTIIGKNAGLRHLFCQTLSFMGTGSK